MQLARNVKTREIDIVPEGYEVSTSWVSLGYGWRTHDPAKGTPVIPCAQEIEICRRNGFMKKGPVSSFQKYGSDSDFDFYRLLHAAEKDTTEAPAPEECAQLLSEAPIMEDDEEVFSAEDVLAIVRFIKLYPGCFFEEK